MKPETLSLEAEPIFAKRGLPLLISGLCLAFAFFGIWSNSYGIMASMKKGGYFLAFTLALVFLLYPTVPGGKRLRWLDYSLAVLGALTGLYTVFTTDRLAAEMLAAKPMDLFMAGIAVLLVIEAARRCIGIWMAVLPLIFSLYALYGNLIPGPLGHYGFTLSRFLLRMYLVDEGIYGITTQVASSYIFLFILFGALLAQSGVGQFFTDLANRIAGAAPGGPAKVATISSGLMGTISGSAAANVATTGAFTIPMMKKIGFKPEFAGAVEAVASTGGMVMPPIMGAAGFIIAQYLGINYAKVMVAALIPALLYYLSVYSWVHFEALRIGNTGIPRSEIPPITDFKRRVFLLAPLVTIIIALLQGKTPIFAAFLGMVATVLVGFIQVERLTLIKILQGLEEGARASLTAIMACIAAGIIVGVASMTGIGQVITYNISVLSGDNMFLALLLTAISSLILSMGLPATACYIIVATIVAPALVRMGAIPLAAHMFVFYFSCLSNITPPVAIASYTAAGIADAKPMAVAWNSIRIAAPGFIVPFLFVYNPILLAQNITVITLVRSLITASIGVVFMAVGGVGFFLRRTPLPQRLLYIGGSFLLIMTSLRTDIMGVSLVGAAVLMDYLATRRAGKGQGKTINLPGGGQK